jgi:hypothetical protein
MGFSMKPSSDKGVPPFMESPIFSRKNGEPRGYELRNSQSHDRQKPS